MDIIVIIIIAFISLFLGWLLARTLSKGTSITEIEELKNVINDLKTEKKFAESQVINLKSEKEVIENKLDNLNSEFINVNSNLSKEKERNENLNQKLQEQKNEIEELQKKFTLEFENLANRIFEEKSKKFTEQNRENLDDLLKPLGEKIKDFEKKVESTYEKEARDRTSLSGEIKKLFELNQQISKEAQNLTTALKGESKTRGNWGEIILESILEKSGLVKDREYFIQKSFFKDGRRLHPDVIVKFPGNRDVIIDSKVSLIAYEKFSNAETTGEQEIALKEHVQAVKKHIDELSSKNYHDIYEINTLDFVMLFIPIEPSYHAAIQGDPNIWNYAYDKRILLLSPTNLFAILKMTEKIWQQEYQSRNAFEIAKSGGDLYDKFVGFVDDLKNIGKKIDDSKQSYDAAINKLSDGRGNLISRAEKLRELGAKTKKQIPQEMLDKIERE